MLIAERLRVNIVFIDVVDTRQSNKIPAPIVTSTLFAKAITLHALG